MPEPTIPYATEWVLVEDNTEIEYRNNISWSPAGLFKNPKRRVVRSKTYEATFVDQENDPRVVPAYINTILEWTNLPNPENLSPTGVNKNQWHIDDKSYTKEISTPMTRHVRITWVMQGDWTDYTE